MNDLIIIGGGPAGVAAAIYAARKRLSTVLITKEVGGQSIVSDSIENWIGTTKLSGTELAKNLVAHLEAVKADILELSIGEEVMALRKNMNTDGFVVEKKGGATHGGRAVLVASGAGRRKLEVPGATEFENKGVTYCASCDGPLFADMDVAVVGGGNAGFETALQLLAYAKSVTLIHRHKDFKADAVTVEKARAHPNMRILTHVEPTEVVGGPAGGFVTGLRYQDKDSGEIHELAVTGIFVEAGVIPNTTFAEGLLTLDSVKRIVVDAKNQRTNIEGVWAAGDCTDDLYHQNNIAAGDGVKALEDLYLWLKKR